MLLVDDTEHGPHRDKGRLGHPHSSVAHSRVVILFRSCPQRPHISEKLQEVRQENQLYHTERTYQLLIMWPICETTCLHVSVASGCV